MLIYSIRFRALAKERVPLSVLLNKLQQFNGEQIVVVMSDNRAFRGTLVEFDEGSMVLRNVVEGIPANAGSWEETTVSTGVIHKIVTWQGVFSHKENKPEFVRLKDVVIQISGVLRIWEFATQNLGKPEHVEVGEAGDAGRRSGTTVSRP